MITRGGSRPSARGVGQPAVVEDLEEDVPDFGCAFSNSSSSTTENGCLRTAAISGRPAARRRVAEQLLEAVRGLVLAHVEADHPVARAEEELAPGLRDLRLAGAGRADEEEHAERPGRIGEPRLDQRDPVDDAFDRLRLPEHAGSEVGTDPVRLSGALGSRTCRGSPVASLSVAITVSGSIAVATPRAIRSRTSSSTPDVPGRGRRRQIVGGEVERLRERLVVDVQFVLGRPVPRVSIAFAPDAGSTLTTSNSRAMRGRCCSTSS